MKTIFIIDASNYIFRSYFAIRNMISSKGVATNALYGFVRAILKLEKDFSFDYIAIVFDGPRNKASRTSLYAEYKGNREKAPEDLYPQIQLAKDFSKAYGLPIIEIDGVEADDAMGAVARFFKSKGYISYLCSSDKDLCQLVDEKTFIVHTHKENAIIDKSKVVEKYGVTPDQFIDYLAIVGDSSDNIPGIKGFGPKTASSLLQEFGTLKNLLKNISTLKNKKQAEKIKEEEKNALLSYALATIDVNLQVPTDLNFYLHKKPDNETLCAFYKQVEFNSLLKEIELQNDEPSENIAQILINDESSLKGLIKSLEKEKSICINVKETGIGIGVKCGVGYYIPLNGKIGEEFFVNTLKPFFNRKVSFFGHNIKESMHLLSKWGLNILHADFDTLIASYILCSHFIKHDLALLSELYLGVKISSLDETSAKKKKPTFGSLNLEEACNFCCKEINAIIRLKEIFENQIIEKNFEKLFYEIEMPLLPILFQMEEHGIFLNEDYLSEYSTELTQKISTLSEEIQKMAGKTFNVNSPKQLSVVLFEDLGIKSLKNTKTGGSTGADILHSLENKHPIIKLLLQYRTLEKLRSTYVDALPKEINPKTKRIHCTFNQSGTVTGRLSCSNPNLQNIPIRGEEGIKVRKGFVPEKKGWVFLSLDYSQIELRILAHMSKEKRLIDAFNQDKDIHIDTAAQVFNVPIEKVTKEMRYRAKAVNFGLLYGQKAFGLAKELGISPVESKKIIDTYFEKYPKVKIFMDSLMEKAHKEKKTTSLLGRERSLNDIDSKNFAIRAGNERIAINAPIQGSQSDIIKIAMIKIDKIIKENNWKSFLVLQIHDELIFECDKQEIESCKKLIKIAMESAYPLLVPLKVDVSIGKNWSEC
jgi:DNA polymerase-1